MVERLKARLVTKGFNQTTGFDFSETFSLVKFPTIRVILIISLAHGWDLMQVEVNNAFLHGFLDEEG